MEQPVTREWLLSLPGIRPTEDGSLYAPLDWWNEFLPLEFEFTGDGCRCWARTRAGMVELRCEITRANVLVLLAAFGPPVETEVA